MAVPTTRRRRSGFHPVLALLLVAVGVVGAVGTLHATGRVHIEAIDRLLGKKVVRAADDNVVFVPVGSVTLLPGHKIKPEDLWDPSTSTYRVVRVPKDKMKEHPDWLLRPDLLVGRVLAREKMPWKAFTEADLLPPGSQEGAVSLVPDGMRLLSLDASKVRGLDQLRYGDRFDLVVSEQVDPELFDQAEKALERQSVGQVDRRLELASLKEMAHQRVLVQDGVLIQAAPVDAKAKEKDALVAVHPEEVMLLLEALDLEQTVYSVARSGKAGVVEERSIPDHEPPLEKLRWVWETVKEVEVLEGSERKSVTVPRVN